MGDEIPRSKAAQDYARKELGMAPNEPNDATGFSTYCDFMDLSAAFDAGRKSADA